jgi:NAD(P)-dependent dehydrogenase (short-subunit alcohol dehydrogenase family)
MAAALKLFNAKHINPPADPTMSLSGKVVIITGANTGLGYEAAIKFTRLGASKLILGVRSLEKGNAAKSSIEMLFLGHESVIEVWSLDMSSYPSIRAFVEQCNKLMAIDIVILNAGVMMKDFEQSQYGWETTLQVNTLSTTLLALLLLPKFKEHKQNYKQAPVLEFVSSDLYRNVIMPDEDEPKPLNLDSYSFDIPMQSYNTNINFSGRKQYARSKFFLQCAILSIAKIAGHEKDIDVLVTSVSPGLCASDLGRAYVPTNPILQFLFFLVKFIFVKTGEQGARSIVSGALIKAEGGVQGGYWKDDRWQA